MNALNIEVKKGAEKTKQDVENIMTTEGSTAGADGGN
jgi:hypothetical protein